MQEEKYKYLAVNFDGQQVPVEESDKSEYEMWLSTGDYYGGHQYCWRSECKKYVFRELRSLTWKEIKLEDCRRFVEADLKPHHSAMAEWMDESFRC